MTSEHPTITLFRDEHTRRGGTGQVVILPDSVHTAALAAEALGCEVGAIANSLLFDADGAPVLIPTPRPPPTPACVPRPAGQVMGGASPIGPPAPVPTYLDSWLRRYDPVWAAAG